MQTTTKRKPDYLLVEKFLSTKVDYYVECFSTLRDERFFFTFD